MTTKMLRVSIVTFMLATMVLFGQDNKNKSNDGTQVTGIAQAAAGQQHGNDAVGGVSSGDATGSYDASGKCKANCGTSGNANANAKAGGSDASTETSFKTNSNAAVNSLAQSSGQKNKDAVKGTAQQANWGFVGDDSNGAGGSNTTSGDYSDRIGSKNKDPKVSGKANSTGATIGSVTTTDTSNAAQIKSSGSSDAKLASPQLGANCSNQKPNGSVQVNGQGAIGAVSTIGGGPNDNSYAGASIDGTTAYNATGKQAASGSQALTGNTKAVITPTSVSSSATVTSTTKTGGH